MKVFEVIGILCISAVLLGFELKAKHERKTQLTIIFITVTAATIGVLLRMVEKLPGPTQFMFLLLHGLSKKLGME